MDTSEIADRPVSPWQPETNLRRIAVLGKAQEELHELIVAFSTQETNLPDEIADVFSICRHITHEFGVSILGAVALSSTAEQSFGDLGILLARCLIQGVDGSDPRTGFSNRKALPGTLASVIASCENLIEALQFDKSAILKRSMLKYDYLDKWLDTLGPKP